jgi:hypothetical protein
MADAMISEAVTSMETADGDQDPDAEPDYRKVADRNNNVEANQETEERPGNEGDGEWTLIEKKKVTSRDRKEGNQNTNGNMTEAEIDKRVIQPSGANAKSFTTDPVGLASGIQSSPISVMQPVDIRVNPRANVVAIEFGEGKTNEIQTLLRITSIGKWTVSCYQPGSRNTLSYGVIKGIDLDVDLK